ncbi:hypothetical protein [Streptomyces sp. NBC_00872]|uniref:hypothetical protein n=1 Tax=Streptomyces sp. NBC_00872 TaxID=2903686 RepID=UPI003865C896|nr:hypothetical protein OG214_27595 [Streptomyces sp. NBC_00872]
MAIGFFRTTFPQVKTCMCTLSGVQPDSSAATCGFSWDRASGPRGASRFPDRRLTVHFTRTLVLQGAEESFGHGVLESDPGANSADMQSLPRSEGNIARTERFVFFSALLIALDIRTRACSPAGIFRCPRPRVGFNAPGSVWLYRDSQSRSFEQVKPSMPGDGGHLLHSGEYVS